MALFFVSFASNFWMSCAMEVKILGKQLATTLAVDSKGDGSRFLALDRLVLYECMTAKLSKTFYI